MGIGVASEEEATAEPCSERGSVTQLACFRERETCLLLARLQLSTWAAGMSEILQLHASQPRMIRLAVRFV